MNRFLSIRWTISKGQDTYGYNICTLTDGNTGKRYRTLGGGYDMLGTVFGEWLQDNYKDAIIALGDGNLEGDYCSSYAGYYGATKMNGKLWLEGDCGLSSMQAIAKAIGLEVKSCYNNRKRETEGFYVTEAMKEVA